MNWKKNSQSIWEPSKWYRKRVTSVLLSVSACPLGCGWYPAVATSLVSIVAHRAAMALHTNCRLLYASTVIWAPYEMSSMSSILGATTAAVTLTSKIVFVRLLSQSFMKITKHLPCLLFLAGLNCQWPQKLVDHLVEIVVSTRVVWSRPIPTPQPAFSYVAQDFWSFCVGPRIEDEEFCFHFALWQGKLLW